MRFGAIAVDEAAGVILAHAVDAGGRRFRKAHVVTPQDVEIFLAAGLTQVVAAVLDPGDLGEDEAARRLAAALVCRGVAAKAAATGRVNIHADAAGVFTVDKALIDAVNAVDPAITIATLAPYAAVETGQMVATVKIIPFAVAGALVERAIAACAGRESFAVHAFRPARIGLIQTLLPGVKPSVLDKTARTMAARLVRSGSEIVAEKRVGHDPAAVTEAIHALAGATDMVIVFGASAMSDPEDVIPAAIRAAGGEVERVGMPVDPGNLLVLGRLGGKPVLGAPGCARSPKENGFDWVLDRLLAELDVADEDIAGMGVGGLLMEIASRPQPRERAAAPRRPSVYAILLAAGRSSRMGGPNKLLARFDGEPLLRRSARRLRASRIAGTVAVTGHRAPEMLRTLDGVPVDVIENPAFAEGLSTSLKAGLRAVPADADGVLVALADMPAVLTQDYDRLIEAFEKAGGTAVVRAVAEGKRGNPVILPRALFPLVATLEGDTGAKHIVEAGHAEIVEVEIGEGAGLDVDTPQALADAGGVLAD